MSDEQKPMPCAPDNCPCPPPPSRREQFKKAAACVCSAGGGILAGHAGCVIAPMLMFAVGASTMGPAVPIIGIAFGLAATSGSLYVWHKLRGSTASALEKKVVVGSAIAGLVLSAAFHVVAHRQHAKESQSLIDYLCTTPTASKSPTPPTANKP